MRTIYKQQLDIKDLQVVEIQKNSKILHIDTQGEHSVCMWYECESTEEKVELNIHCFGTGHEMPAQDDNLEYIGTVLILNGHGVFHYYISPVFKSWNIHRI